MTKAVSPIITVSRAARDLNVTPSRVYQIAAELGITLLPIPGAEHIHHIAPADFDLMEGRNKKRGWTAGRPRKRAARKQGRP